MPDQTTAKWAAASGVDHGGDRVGGVVEAVDELEAERDQQRHAWIDFRQSRNA
jgi:hypothetical protein